jgi:hypothetical protein
LTASAPHGVLWCEQNQNRPPLWMTVPSAISSPSRSASRSRAAGSCCAGSSRSTRRTMPASSSPPGWSSISNRPVARSMKSTRCSGSARRAGSTARAPLRPVCRLHLELLQLGFGALQPRRRGIDVAPPGRRFELGLRLAQFLRPIVAAVHDRDCTWEPARNESGRRSTASFCTARLGQEPADSSTTNRMASSVAALIALRSLPSVMARPR